MAKSRDGRSVGRSKKATITLALPFPDRKKLCFVTLAAKAEETKGKQNTKKIFAEKKKKVAFLMLR